MPVIDIDKWKLFGKLVRVIVVADYVDIFVLGNIYECMRYDVKMKNVYQQILYFI